MNSHILDEDLLLGPILGVDLKVLEVGENVVTGNHLTEDSILAIEMWRRSKADKELATVGAWAFVSHAHYPSAIVSKRRANLILKGLVPDRIGDFRTGGCRRSSLEHEGRHQSMDGRVVVCRRGAES